MLTFRPRTGKAKFIYYARIISGGALSVCDPFEEAILDGGRKERSIELTQRSWLKVFTFWPWASQLSERSVKCSYLRRAGFAHASRVAHNWGRRLIEVQGGIFFSLRNRTTDMASVANVSLINDLKRDLATSDCDVKATLLIRGRTSHWPLVVMKGPWPSLCYRSFPVKFCSNGSSKKITEIPKRTRADDSSYSKNSKWISHYRTSKKRFLPLVVFE